MNNKVARKGNKASRIPVKERIRNILISMDERWTKAPWYYEVILCVLFSVSLYTLLSSIEG